MTLLKDKTIRSVNGTHEKIYTQEEYATFIDSLISKEKYLIQNFIECKAKSGLTYDFRLHVQKNHEGKWVITLIYPRICGSNKLTSNISSGGYRGELLSFLKEEFEEDYFDIKQMLEYFAVSFAYHFESLYDNRMFDELGIDIGIDNQRRLWLFEVNWRPGSKHREFSVAKNVIPYARYLAEFHK